MIQLPEINMDNKTKTKTALIQLITESMIRKHKLLQTNLCIHIRYQ
jgi:hypothetical protein